MGITLSQLRSTLGAALVACLPLSAASVAHAAEACYDFEFLNAGTAYTVGSVIVGADAEIRLARFRWDNGQWTADGVATVVESTNAEGSAQNELNLNNIVTRIFPDVGATRAEFVYADFGGNVNFGVNGDFRNVANLAALDGSLVGGCRVSVTSGDILDAGVVVGTRGDVIVEPEQVATIDVFSVGGQEFYVDDVCHEW